jgi:predicted esterase
MAEIAIELSNKLPNAAVAALDGLEHFNGGVDARQWFSIVCITDASRPARFAAALPRREGLIASKGTLAAVDGTQTALLGFSQGAIMRYRRRNRRGNSFCSITTNVRSMTQPLGDGLRSMLLLT